MRQLATQTERKVVNAMATIEALGLRKTFGTTVALDGIDLRVEEGRILGLVGPNGAGKTTALNAILGLTSYKGELKVLGRDPWTERDQLMQDVSFIADVAVLPRWIRESGRLSGKDCDQAHEQGKRIVERHGSPAAPRPGHGHRREIVGAG
jgi:ABC-type transport system involved in cytochrome bd biosynthesis fused ATPase/permease subunit